MQGGLPYADRLALAGKTDILATSDVKDFKKIPWLQIRACPPRP
jgi:hypothetical protein